MYVPQRCARTLTLGVHQAAAEDQESHGEFVPIMPPLWPPPSALPPHSSSPPSSPTSLSQPSSPPSSPAPQPLRLAYSLHPPTTPPPPIHTSLKRERIADEKVDNGYHPYKQQKINHFFTKLTQAEGAEQATRRLVQTADAREEWVEKEEAKKRVKKASRKAANTRSQQECRTRKKESEIQSGRRGQDGKVKKVIESNS